MVITIVGAGASALALLYNYLQKIPGDEAQASTVYIVEKRGAFGPGAAYDEDLASNLLNTKTGFITPFHDRPGDFYHWLMENQRLWKRAFPGYRIDPDNYAPRPLFGMYMQTRMTWIVKQALQKNVRIIQVDAEAVDIARVGNSYITKTNCSLNLASDYVFLCCGTLPAVQPDYAQAHTERVLPIPYPVSELRHRIPPDAAVAVIGARLSSIDAVVGLVEGGHRGHITMHSRSGYFPSVRGTQGRITPQVLTASHIDTLVKAKGSLTLQDVAQLVMHELALVTGKVAQLPPLPPAPFTCLQTYLSEEIELAKDARAWQAVLYCTNAIIDQLWRALDDDAKTELLSTYFSAFMAYRVSIPSENAQKILSYLREGRLSFVAGDFTISVTAEGKPRVAMKTGEGAAVEYDYLVNATGSPRTVDGLDSRLISNLLAKGMLVPHEFGGVLIDTTSYAAINASGTADSRLFVLGELTVGAFFFISALDINARHARNCATAFAEMVYGDRQVAEHARVRHG